MSARDKQLSHLSIFFKSTSILTGSNFFIKNLTIFHEYLIQEKFEDTKSVISSRKSKRDILFN
jgi:hypothetical protein